MHTTFCFYYQFSVKYKFPFPIFAFFTTKSPSITLTSVSQENVSKRAKTRHLDFSPKIWAQIILLLLPKNKKSTVWIQGNSICYGLWPKCTQLWPLNHISNFSSAVKDCSTHIWLEKQGCGCQGILMHHQLKPLPL